MHASLQSIIYLKLLLQIKEFIKKVKMLIIIDFYHHYHNRDILFELYKSRSKCKKMMKGITSQSYLGHAHERE